MREKERERKKERKERSTRTVLTTTRSPFRMRGGGTSVHELDHDVYAVHVKLRAATTHTGPVHASSRWLRVFHCLQRRVDAGFSFLGMDATAATAATPRRTKKKGSGSSVDRTANDRSSKRASRRSVEQAVLPIGWHCVQRRGARPPSAFIVFPRRASSRLGGARRFSPLSVPRVPCRGRRGRRLTPDPHLYLSILPYTPLLNSSLLFPYHLLNF